MRLIPLPSAALILGASAFASTAANAASANGSGYTSSGSYSNSSTYNGGIGRVGQENHLGRAGNRDPNGNLLIVNGLISQAGQVAQQESVQTSGTGVGGVGGGQASATAIGNNLNVQVSGQWNTVIVNSKQTNTGSQSASAGLNGQLTF